MDPIKTVTNIKEKLKQFVKKKTLKPKVRISSGKMTNNFSGLVFIALVITESEYNWKLFIDSNVRNLLWIVPIFLMSNSDEFPNKMRCEKIDEIAIKTQFDLLYVYRLYKSN